MPERRKRRIWTKEQKLEIIEKHLKEHITELLLEEHKKHKIYYVRKTNK